MSLPISPFSNPGPEAVPEEDVAPDLAVTALVQRLLRANKSFGDAGNTQTRVDHGEFGPGSGTANHNAALEQKAIAHFGAADELVGQQFVTPNGTILDLRGDGHSAIHEVTGGRFMGAPDRAIDAGFVRTSVDTVTTTEPGRYAQSVVLEFSRPMTDAQIGTIIDNVRQLDVQSFGIDVTTPGDNNRPLAMDTSGFKYSQEQAEPSRSDIAGMIRDANVAAGGAINAYQVAEIIKSFGDPGNTQERVEHGEFGPGSNSQGNHPGIQPARFADRLTTTGRRYTSDYFDAVNMDTQNLYRAENQARTLYGVGKTFTTEEEAQAAANALWAQYGNGNPADAPVIFLQTNTMGAAVAQASGVLGETEPRLLGGAVYGQSGASMAIDLYPGGQNEIVLDHEMAHAITMTSGSYGGGSAAHDDYPDVGGHGAAMRDVYNTILLGTGQRDYADYIAAKSQIPWTKAESQRIPLASLYKDGKRVVTCYGVAS